MSAHRDPNESVEQPRETPLCANNCGFFANPACMGYCSKCYRDIAGVEQQNVEKPKEESSGLAAGTVAPAAVPATPQALPRPDASPVAEVRDPVAPPARVSKSRCGVCRKKVGLTGFTCKCGSVFCGAHRYAESHACTFDHKSNGRVRLAQDNPVVQGSKLDRL